MHLRALACHWGWWISQSVSWVCPLPRSFYLAQLKCFPARALGTCWTQSFVYCTPLWWTWLNRCDCCRMENWKSSNHLPIVSESTSLLQSKVLKFPLQATSKVCFWFWFHPAAKASYAFRNCRTVVQTCQTFRISFFWLDSMLRPLTSLMCLERVLLRLTAIKSRFMNIHLNRVSLCTRL